MYFGSVSLNLSGAGGKLNKVTYPMYYVANPNGHNPLFI
jgi:hypothetical protein